MDLNNLFSDDSHLIGRTVIITSPHWRYPQSVTITDTELAPNPLKPGIEHWLWAHYAVENP